MAHKIIVRFLRIAVRLTRARVALPVTLAMVMVVVAMVNHIFGLNKRERGEGCEKDVLKGTPKKLVPRATVFQLFSKNRIMWPEYLTPIHQLGRSTSTTITAQHFIPCGLWECR